MLVDDKPSLDESLLTHFGIPGMKWGHRKPDYIPVGRSGAAGVNYGSRPNVRSAANPSAAPRSVPQRQGMSTGKKVAIGVGIVGGAAAAAYFLSKTGTRPMAQSMTSRSNRAGLKMTLSVLKNSGKVSVKSLKVGGKVAKVGGKVGFKTTKLAGKGVAKGSTAIARNSYKGASEFISNLKSKPNATSAVRGERFGRLLLGEYGPGSSSGGGAILGVRRRKRG